MLLTIDPIEPEPWLVARAVDVLRRGGVVVTPTDTVYGLACSISHPEAIERVYALKKLDPKKPLAIMVADLQEAGRYAANMTTPAYRMMKRVLPGPYTFIFEASRDVPKIMLRKRRTIGIRIPDNEILLAVLGELGEPLLTTSIRSPEDEFVNDPEEIESRYERTVDLVVDGGVLTPNPSTIIDLTADQPVLVREGKGRVDALGLYE